jgi:hypothetical protein
MVESQNAQAGLKPLGIALLRYIFKGNSQIRPGYKRVVGTVKADDGGRAAVRARRMPSVIRIPSGMPVDMEKKSALMAPITLLLPCASKSFTVLLSVCPP